MYYFILACKSKKKTSIHQEKCPKQLTRFKKMAVMFIIV